MSERRPALQLRDISKAYDGAVALEDVSVDIEGGTIHALVGENGAGKSTLVKILTGIVHADKGEIIIDGTPQSIGDPRVARRLGIVAIHQEPSVFSELTVAENIFAGQQLRRRFGAVNWRAMRQESVRLLQEIGGDLDPRAPVRGLGVADRQMLEIAKALASEGSLLIMDEPTAALSPNEVTRLFATVRTLVARGVTVLFISHRLEEIKELADSVTVLRDGHLVATRSAEELSESELVSLMIGRALEDLFPSEQRRIGDVVFEARSLRRTGVFSDISFQVRRGEIVGLAGFVGAGRTEVARGIFGIDRLDGGDLLVDGEPYRPTSPRSAMKRGIAYVPEDRLHQGLFPSMAIAPNISMAVLPSLTPMMMLRPQRERTLASQYMEKLRIKGRSPGQVVRSLSGGNQQKVVLSKWLAAAPRLLILDEPTNGVDVGSKAEVHALVSELAAEGLAILLISSELPEILRMSDRILVMREGLLIGELSRADATEELIIRAAAGIAA
jgi:rhamnose transport system ATP-binding protein